MVYTTKYIIIGDRMRFIPKQLFHKQEIAALLRAGENAVQNDHYKDAVSAFEEAAALGSSEAMMQLARLCLTRTASRIDPFAMIEKITQGSPVFPYDLACGFFPDDKAAIKWLSRAAELKNPEAACLLGCMLCEGIGCDADQAEGLRYLRLAMKYGSTDARKLLWLYQPDGTRLTDEAYEPGTAVEVDVRGRRIEGKVTELPFYKKENR